MEGIEEKKKFLFYSDEKNNEFFLILNEWKPERIPFKKKH